MTIYRVTYFMNISKLKQAYIIIETVREFIYIL